MFFKKNPKKNECLYEFIKINSKNGETVLNTKHVQLISINKEEKSIELQMQNGACNTLVCLTDEAFNETKDGILRIFCNIKKGE